MSGRRRAQAALALWMAVLGVILVGLHAAGSGPLAPPPAHDLPEWLEATGAATAAVAVVRLGALALGWYLLLVTALSLAVRLAPNAGSTAAAMIERPAPAFVRRLVHAAAGVSLAAGAVTVAPAPVPGRSGAPAAAATDGTAADPDAATTDPGAVTMRRVDDGPVVLRRLPDDAAAEDPSGPPPATWTVRPGDHLWSVAEQVLLAAWQRPATDREIDPYWRAVVDANRHLLVRPGVPDLLLPGQVLEVPPPPGPPPVPQV